MSDTTALAIRRPAQLGGYQAPPDRSEFAALAEMANNLAKARGFIPAHFDSQPFKILAAMLYGRDLGISPTNALQHIIVIDGKATADAQLIGMLVRRAGHRLEDVTTDRQSTVKITRGDDGSVHEFTFSIEDATRAGLVRQGSAWQKYPKSMVYARALTGCARKGAQDALMGVIYTPEELGAEVDEEGTVIALPPSPTVAGDIPLEAVAQHGGAASPPSPAPVEVPPGSIASGAGSDQRQGVQDSPPSTAIQEPAAAVTPPPPQAPAPHVPVAPLSGPALARRMGAGRSIGPAPRRQNVVTVEQGAERPATAPEAAAPPVAQVAPVPSQPAPSGLTDEPDLPAAPVDDGLDGNRQILRESAGELLHVNAILENVKRGLEGKEAQPVPGKEPSDASDQALGARIDTEWPGRKLVNLKAAELQNLLERFESNLAKKRGLMQERGIQEE